MKHFLLAAFVLLAERAHAAFDALPSGARAAGLSGAFVAAAGDATALFFNPAGLKELDRPELAAQYGRLVAGLDDGSAVSQTMLAYARPLGPGAAAFSYSSLKVSGLYEERVLSAGYGRAFLDGRLGLGLTAKHLHAGYGGDSGNAIDDSGEETGAGDPALAAAGASALAFDAGLQYRWSSRLRLGFSVLNLNRPSMGSSSPVARTAALGLAADLGPGRLSADLLRQEVLDGEGDLVAAAGYEASKSFKSQTVFLRAGARLGGRGQRQLNAGLGWRHDALQVDYAMTLPVSALQASNHSQQVSVSFRFAPAPTAAP
jgi:hypothetical protein